MRSLGKTIVYMDGIPPVTCDGAVIGFLEGFIDRVVVGKFEGLLLGA